MKKLYYEDKKDYKWIANYFGFKSKSAIYDRFKVLGLKARDNTDLKTGTKHSEETKKKIGLAGIGRKFSEETKNKMRERVSGERNPMFKSRPTIQCGYRFIWRNGKRIREHHYIWERYNGPIPKGHHIHHIDGNRLNNKIENLQLLTHSEHIILHNKQRNYKLKERDALGRFKPF